MRPEGDVLDPGGFKIAAYGSLPEVVFDGTNNVVAWYDQGLRFARVTPEGAVLDQGGILVTPGLPAHWARPALASNGAGALMVWTDERNDESDIYAARITPGGLVLDPDDLPIAAAPGDQHDPVATFDGDHYVVAWTDDRVRAARVSPQGGVLDPGGIVLSGDAPSDRTRAAAFDGENIIVTWTQGQDETSKVFAGRLSPAGTPLDPGGILIAQDRPEYHEVALAGRSGGALAVWITDGYDYRKHLYGSLLDASARPVEPGGVPIAVAPGDQVWPAVAFDGQSYVVVWSDNREYMRNLYATRVTPSGEVLDPAGILVAVTSDIDTYPAAVFDGKNTVVVWQVVCCMVGELYAARISPEGVPLDLDPKNLGIVGLDPVEFHVASDGTGTVIVAQADEGDFEEPRAVRLDQEGTVTRLGELMIAGRNGTPRIAFDGTHYLLLWRRFPDEFEPGEKRSTLFGAHLSGAGEWLDEPFAIREGIIVDFAATRLGANGVVVWQEEQGDTIELRAVEVTPQGAISGAGARPLASGATRPSLALASSGERATALWLDSSTAGIDLAGVELSPGLLHGPAFPVATGVDVEPWAQIAGDQGGGYLAVYTRGGPDSRRALGRLLGEAEAQPAGQPIVAGGGWGCVMSGGRPAGAPLALLALCAMAAARRPRRGEPRRTR